VTDGVSVVVPTRNRGGLLAATLASVLGQRDARFEVIVVDDGSEEPARAPEPGTTAVPVQVIRHPAARGVAAARNTGLAAASMAWVAFTDDDDLWAPAKLAAQLGAVADHAKAAWSCVGAVKVDDGLDVIGISRPPPSGEVASLLLARNCIPGGGSGVLARTALLRELGGFDTALSICADFDMWIRLALRSPVAAVDRPLLAYRVHGGAMSGALAGIDRELAYLWAKHGDERERRDLVPDAGIHAWIGDRLQRSHQRRRAAAAFLRAAPSLGRPRAAARAVESAVWPSAYRWRDARRTRAIPAAWADEAAQWLAPLRGREPGAAGGPVSPPPAAAPVRPT